MNENGKISSHTRALQGRSCRNLGGMCRGKKKLHFGGILDPKVLCSQFLSAFISISMLPHVVFSQWFFGPRSQASSRGQPNEGTNESLPCVHVCSGFCIVCPYQCRQGSMRYVPNRDQQRHGFLMFPFSSVVARRPARHGQCCQNKAS